MRVRVCVRVRACVRVQKAAAMSSGLDLRKRGKRVDPAKRGPRSQRPSPLTAIDAGDPGEIRISNDTMIALQHLYNSSPSIQAARAILQGQLLSSGCVVRRGGRDVNLKDTFSRHLEDVWVPFARGVIDHFLMFGFVVVSLEEEGPPPFANFVRGKQMAATSHMGPLGDRDAGRREPLSASEMRKRKLPITDDSRLDARAAAGKLGGGVNLVPAIPDIGQYELSFVHVGEVCCVQFKPSKHTHTHTHTQRCVLVRRPTTSGSTASSRPTRTTCASPPRARTFETFLSGCAQPRPARSRRCTGKTTAPRSSSRRRPTSPATCARPWRPSSSRPRSSRRSRSWRCRPRSCARGRCW